MFSPEKKEKEKEKEKEMLMAAVAKSISPCPGALQFAVIALRSAWFDGCHIIPIDPESSDTSESCRNFSHTHINENIIPKLGPEWVILLAVSFETEFSLYQPANVTGPVSVSWRVEWRCEPFISTPGVFRQVRRDHSWEIYILTCRSLRLATPLV